jgi:hypothetical protein
MKIRFSTSLAISIFAVFPQLCGAEQHCSVSPIYNAYPWGYVYGSSYNEWIQVDPMKGKVKLTDPEIIFDVPGHNHSCVAQLTASKSISWAETIKHTKTGTLNAEVAFKVGEKDVAELGFTTGYTKTNGWEWGSTLNETITLSPKNVPPKSIYSYKVYGRKKALTIEGSGRYAFQVAFIRDIFSPLEYYDGTCNESSSTAIGEKKFFSIEERFTARPDGNTCPGCEL